MRRIIKRSSSTKTERIFSEILKKNRIPFTHHYKVSNMEIDFLVGNYAIEIDGHSQSSSRNGDLIKLGYHPIHYSNNAIRENSSYVEQSIKQKYGLYTANNR
jgi:very-short-patch-repair endonuclease